QAASFLTAWALPHTLPVYHDGVSINKLPVHLAFYKAAVMNTKKNASAIATKGSVRGFPFRITFKQVFSLILELLVLEPFWVGSIPYQTAGNSTISSTEKPWFKRD
ncbi:hypothetical protein, partial [Vibrio parahaemolyticus]|uniref:hypothetical protein n=1 Tax=Vibrio parahaemolyticus TaxID=670 RepID=UPI001E32A0BE